MKRTRERALTIFYQYEQKKFAKLTGRIIKMWCKNKEMDNIEVLGEDTTTKYIFCNDKAGNTHVDSAVHKNVAVTADDHDVYDD